MNERRTYRTMSVVEGYEGEGMPSAYLFEPQEWVRDEEDWVADAMREQCNPMIPLQTIMGGYVKPHDFYYSGNGVAKTLRSRGKQRRHSRR
jgi:hypothetical protein